MKRVMIANARWLKQIARRRCHQLRAATRWIIRRAPPAPERPDQRFRFSASEARATKASAPWTATEMKSMIFGQAVAIKSAHDFSILELCFMDVMIFLKLVPAVIGLAGLLTYVMMRAREPASDLELVNVVQRVRNIFLVLGCVALIMLSAWLILWAAPPDQDTSPSGFSACPYRRFAVETVVDGHSPRRYPAPAS
jgi:hypothetical protein